MMVAQPVDPSPTHGGSSAAGAPPAFRPIAPAVASGSASENNNKAESMQLVVDIPI